MSEPLFSLSHLPGAPRLDWRELFREATLYQSALALFARPLFNWRKALQRGIDDRTLYDYARRGPANVSRLAAKLAAEDFMFEPYLEKNLSVRGRNRRVYIARWEDRLVEYCLYKTLNRACDPLFSRHSYAYRERGIGIDLCQKRIARRVGGQAEALFLLKRDLSQFFYSIDHRPLLSYLHSLVTPGDFLAGLLVQRIQFFFRAEDGVTRRAIQGVPFGSPLACFFANLFLTELDHALARIPGLYFFRYADDYLFVARDRGIAGEASRLFHTWIAALGLEEKVAAHGDLIFSPRPVDLEGFTPATHFRHLGLEFRANGPVGLSRDKFRKICNLFRFSFRRKKARFGRLSGPREKIDLAIDLARKTLEEGLRNVAIIDYYLKHVADENQLARLDRWLAEEVLALAYGGHKKGHFKKMPYPALRARGLPSLLHRSRRIRHGEIEAPFFAWKRVQYQKGFGARAARPNEETDLEGRPSPHARKQR